jgi:hypothetical protein
VAELADYRSRLGASKWIESGCWKKNMDGKILGEKLFVSLGDKHPGLDGCFCCRLLYSLPSERLHRNLTWTILEDPGKPQRTDVIHLLDVLQVR